MTIENYYDYLLRQDRNLSSYSSGTKSKVDNILKINEIEKIFIEKWFESYYDFYFLKIDDFKKILEENEEIRSFFHKKTWKAISKISRTDFLDFIEIFFKKQNIQELLQDLYLFFQEKWIYYLDSYFLQLDLQNIKDEIYKNNKLKYSFKKLSRKNISELSYDDFWNILKKLWFQEISNTEIFSKIKIYLKERKIFYLDDLKEIPISKFEEFFENEFVNLYFFKKWIYKSFLTREDILKFWEDIWLLNYNYKNWINLFLKDIKNYNNLMSIWTINEIRDFLTSNRACLYILRELNLDYLQDFRSEHIQKFARRIWLEWVPKLESYDEENIKQTIKNIFENNNIKDLYTLKFYWIRNLRKWILMKKNIWKIYDKINTYIKNLTWKIIPKLESLDLEIIWKDIWLYEYTEQEQKDRFLRILKIAELDLDTMIASDFKRRSFLWKHSQIHYILENSGCPSDKKLFRTEHLDLIRKYFEKSE